jgi:hypothetical protein
MRLGIKNSYPFQVYRGEARFAGQGKQWGEGSDAATVWDLNEIFITSQQEVYIQTL